MSQDIMTKPMKRRLKESLEKWRGCTGERYGTRLLGSSIGLINNCLNS